MGNKVEIIISARDKTNRAFSAVSAGLKTMAKAAGAAGIAIAGMGIAVVTASVQLNKMMANIATLMPNSIDRVKDLKKSVQEVAIEVGKSTTDIAGGLYQVVSAFGDTSETAEKLRITAKAATAGLATTTEALNLLSGVTKGYGDSTAKAIQKASDLAFLTVKLGQTSFPELAMSMGKVIPFASALGVSQEELFAGFAALTGVTGQTAEVATQLRAVHESMIRPTTGMAKAIDDAGYSSARAMIADLKLAGALQKLIGTTDGSHVAVGKLFGSTEALSAIFAKTGFLSDTFAKKLKGLQKVSGITEAALKEQTEGINKLGFQWEQFKVKAIVSMQKIGDIVAPIFSSILSSADNMLQKFSAVFMKIPEIASVVLSTLRGMFTKFFSDWSYFSAFWENAFKLFIDIEILIGNVLIEMGKMILKSSSVIWVPLGEAFSVLGSIIRVGWQKTILYLQDKMLASAIWIADKLNIILPEAWEFDIAGLESSLAEMQEKIIAPAKTFKEAWEEGGAIVEDLTSSMGDNIGNIKSSFSSTFEGVKAQFSEFAASPEIAEMFEKINEILTVSEERFNEFADKAGGAVKQALGISEESEEEDIWETWFGKTEDVMERIQTLSQETWDMFRQGVGDAIAAVIVDGEDLGQAFGALMKNIAKSVISTLIQIGLERVVQALLTKLLNLQEATSRIAVLAAETYAGAFAATACIPVVGPAMAPGVAAAAQAAMLAGSTAAGAMGAGVGAGIAGIGHGGLEPIPKEATYLLTRGERVLSPRQNRDLDEFMSQGGSTIVVNELNVMPYANIDEALFDKSLVWWTDLAKEKILPALNELGDLRATTTLRYAEE